MAQLINQKFLQGIDSSKFKIAANGALMAVDSQGQLVEILKLNAQDQALLLGVQVASKAALEQVIADLTAEVAARQALDSRVGSLESAMPSKAAKSYVDSQDDAKLAEAKSYADGKINALVNGAPAVLDTLKEIADALGNDANLASTLSGQIASVQSNLTAEISRAEMAEGKALSDAKDYTDSQMSSESSARIAGDAASLASAKSYADGKVSDEAAARVSGDSATLASANLYTDNKVSDETAARLAAQNTLQNNMDDLDAYAQDIRADLDQEISDRQAADAVEAAARASAISAEASARQSAVAAEQAARESAVSAEASARQSADNALDGRVTALENKPSIQLKNKAGVFTASNLDHIDLDFQAAENGVIALYIDRTIVYPGIDFTTSVVGGKTRITFIGELKSPDGSYCVMEGDDFYCVYAI